MKIATSVERRFWRFVDKDSSPLGCWLWTGSVKRNHFGHGCFDYEGRTESAHRIAWLIMRGPIPDGLNVCHRCDNPPCVNAAHLFLGTKKDNAMDAAAKGRFWQQAHPTEAKARTRKAVAKITPQIAATIRAAKGLMTQKALAAQFGIARTTVSSIHTGRSWPDV